MKVMFVGWRQSEGAQHLQKLNAFEPPIPQSQLKYKKKMGSWYLLGEKDPGFLQGISFLFFRYHQHWVAHIISYHITAAQSQLMGEQWGKSKSPLKNWSPLTYHSTKSLLFLYNLPNFCLCCLWYFPVLLSSQPGNIPRKGGSCRGFPQPINN